jgi:glycerol uptake operon antiterminator
VAKRPRTGGRPLLERLAGYPVIASATRDREIAAAAAGRTRAVMLNSIELACLAELVAQAREAGLLCLVHAEMIAGLANDAAAVGYLKSIGADGVMTTRTQTVAATQSLGLIAVQRVFVTDHVAVERSLTTVEHTRPDLVELSPALALGALDAGTRKRFSPLLANGLVTQPSEVEWLRELGAVGVTTSRATLWACDFQPTAGG